MTHPPDRSHVLTEQRNERTMNLHALDVGGCVAAIQREDREIPGALERAAPALTRFIQAVEPGFLAGGRLIYLGAGTSGRLGVLDASEAPPTFQVPPDRIIGIIAGGDAALRASSEGMEDDPLGARPALEALSLGARDAVLAIAAGGRRRSRWEHSPWRRSWAGTGARRSQACSPARVSDKSPAPTTSSSSRPGRRSSRARPA